MKKILIPIDLDLDSYHAIDYAVNFFRNESCEFYFLNMYNYDVDGLKAIDLLQAEDDWFEKPKIASANTLGKVIQRYAANKGNGKHIFRAISECGMLIEGMKKYIIDLKIDLLVLPGKDYNDGRIQRYSRNYKGIIDNIRECPVMLIPSSVEIHENSKFLLVSKFKSELPKNEIEKWYELVKIVNGSVKIIALSEKNQMTVKQRTYLKMLDLQMNMWSGDPVMIEYINNAHELKNYVADHPYHIICLMDRKPDFWRKCRLKHSWIVNLGPLSNTPVIALHR
ncbi:hypothetical protein C5O00_13250 [Pukyongia salina]|uniref:UspA domain-containing protein n=1 Tax=Pukyongia salina TaxID=2094025 RepID=A0A2S0HZM4_9FLAO|nr:universal stress protein [Pukyongia salina]AVI52068.1 hypothetical protein C5O00_13250 [Pukyongia salina]